MELTEYWSISTLSNNNIPIYNLINNLWLIEYRSLIVSLTEKGESLRDKAVNIPYEVAKIYKSLEMEEARTLYQLLYKLLRAL